MAVAVDSPVLLRQTEPAIHVPDDPALALQRLEQLYDSGADVAISRAFEQFAAILGADSDAMGFCYMAETNLGMAGRSRFPEWIEAGIAHFEQKLGSGRYQPGSLYTIGNAHSALGDEVSAKACYQAAFHELALDEGRFWEARVKRSLSDTIFETVFPGLLRVRRAFYRLHGHQAHFVQEAIHLKQRRSD